MQNSINKWKNRQECLDYWAKKFEHMFQRWESNRNRQRLDITNSLRQDVDPKIKSTTLQSYFMEKIYQNQIAHLKNNYKLKSC